MEIIPRDRRRFLAGTLAGLAAVGARASPVEPVSTAPRDSPGRLSLGAAWRGPERDAAQRVGAIEVDWERRRVSIGFAVTVPGRAHGLSAEADGCLLAVAYRFGTWMIRVDPEGRVCARASTERDPSPRAFNGHVVASADGRWLFTAEIDPTSCAGWVGVRDARTLRKLDEWPTHGPDPHQLALTPAGDLVVANGGVLRTPDDRKRDLDRLDSSLVLLDGGRGAMLGLWKPEDPRVSLRHLAWTEVPGASAPLLGIALQGEHEDPTRRAESPVLALWDGRQLSVPTRSADAAGYAGDIAAVPGGFVLSSQTGHRALLWRHDAASELTVVARMREACALAGDPSRGGEVVIGGALGVGRWHPSEAPAMLAWPEPMMLDNHWVVRGRPAR